MKEFLDKLKEKYNYSDELLTFLNKLIPTLTTYYGIDKKDIIFNALLNSEIHIQTKNEDLKEYLNKYFNTNETWDFPELASAMYHNKVSLSNKGYTSKSIVYIKRKFYNTYQEFDFNDIKQLETLTHELCHLIKGYGKTTSYGNKIIDRTGLITTIYEYDKDYNITREQEEFVGIEEALTEIDSRIISEMMTNEVSNSKGYNAAVYSMNILLSNKDLANVLNYSSFYSTNDWIDYIGEENAKILISSFDTLVKAMYVSYSEINTKEKREKLREKMKEAQINIENISEELKTKGASL